MEQGLDLKAFLDNQTRGGTVDSQGSFTVAREKALKKLAHFSLPGEYDWVLKIVQAANIWQAPRLVVRQSRIATSFYFCPPRGTEFPSESAIVQALENLSLSPDNPIHGLAMALRSLVEQCELSFVLAVRQHGEMCKPIFAGADVSALDSKTREEWTQLQWEGVRLTVSHFRPDESLTGRYIPTFSKQARRDVEILDMLERYCFASSVPIEVDRRLVSRVFPRGDYFSTRRRRPLLLGRLTLEPRTAVSELEPISVRIPRGPMVVSASSEGRQQPWFLVSGPEWKTASLSYEVLSRALGPLDRAPSPPVHRLYWIRQGVVVKAYSLPTATTLCELIVFMPADSLRTDLSGLQVATIEDQENPVPAALAALRAELERQLADWPTLRRNLLAEPAGASESAAEAEETRALDQSGETAFSRSIAVGLPTIGLGLLASLDNAAQVMEHLPFHDNRLKRWAKEVELGLKELQTDLREPIKGILPLSF